MKAFLLLGRLGDITTLLPVLKDEAEKGQRPAKLVVSKAFAPLLDGVSYVEPIAFDGPYEQVAEARAYAQKFLNGDALVDCSVYGFNVNVQPSMSSFNREIWKRSGTDLNFDAAVPVFDRRDAAREAALVASMNLPERFFLYAGAGLSSPFAESAAFLAALRERLPHPVVDISDLRSERPYDLLALYERAQGLVATDSFPLHLAAATPGLPVAALACEGPTSWHRSAWKPNHVFRAHYGEALARVDEIPAAFNAPDPKLYFVTTQSPNPDAMTKARLARAQASRKREMVGKHWTDLNIFPDRSGQSIGDKPLPFVRDLIEAAVLDVAPSDIIVLCNADIGFVEGLTGRILEGVQRHGCAFAHRWDFYGSALSRRQPRYESDLKQAQWYPGSDFFAFTPAWWAKHGSIFPDMLWGREAWDMVLRNLMKKTGTEELHNAIWHERHLSPWEQNKRLAGNEHNRRLAGLWLARWGGSWNDWQGPQKYRS